MSLLAIGSFATVLSVLWIISGFLMALLYPLLRPLFMRWHPAMSSNVLLLILAFPAVLSLLTTVLLFIPDVEGSLVTMHCHADCSQHQPLLTSPYIGAIGFVLLFSLLCVTAKRLVESLSLSKSLLSQLSPIAIQYGPWQLLDNESPLVFTLGWRRSQIFLTKGLKDHCQGNELDIILAHEQEHVRRHDSTRLLIAKLLLLPLPGNAGGKLFEDLQLFCESACDFAAARRYDNLDVAQTLLHVQRLVPDHFEFGKWSLTTAFTGAEVATRIRLLVSGRTPVTHSHLFLALAGFLVLALSIALVNPLHHYIESLIG